MNVKTWDGIKINNFQDIAKFARRAGFPAHDSNDVIAAAQTLYRTHQSSRRVGEILGVSDATVRGWLHYVHEPLRPKGGARIFGRLVRIHGDAKLFREWFPPDDWSQEERRSIYNRYVRGRWSLERTLTTPIIPKPRRRNARAAKIATQRELAQKWQNEDYEG